MAERIPIASYRSGAGGSGPVDTADLRVAKYIVGNEPAGDTADVCDFLDPGDGTGLALAIAAAAAANGPADIWLRPGTYDLSLPSTPALPLVLPESAFPALSPTINIRCATPAGPLRAAGLLPAPPGARLVVGDNRHVFTGPPGANSVVCFDGLFFDVQDIVVGAVGAWLVGGDGGAEYGVVGGSLRNCQVRLPSGANVAETLTILFNMGYVEMSACAVLGSYANGAAGGVSLTAVASSQITLRDSALAGCDLAALSTGLLDVIGNTLSCVAGVEVAGGGTQCVVNGNFIQVTAGIGVRLGVGGDGAVVAGNRIRGTGGSSVGVSAEGSNATINGNTFANHDIGVDVPATALRTLIVGNTITSSATAAIQDVGGGTISGFNIT